jgi:hypothetical protein
MKSPAPAGFHEVPRSSIAPAHMNLGKWQAKKIWLQSSGSPQRLHRPFEGPRRLATWSLEGSLLRISCQRKTLILGGTRVRKTSLKWVTVAPCVSPKYTNLVEKVLDGSKDHDTPSGKSETGSSWTSRHRLSHSTISAKLNYRLKCRRHSPEVPYMVLAACTVTKGWS